MKLKNDNKNLIYALDFDGVLCDSVMETAITAWRLAQTIWDDMPLGSPSKEFIEMFREVRPYLKTGYESILIMRLLFKGVLVLELCNNYKDEIQKLINREKLNRDELKKSFGEVRDKWIEEAFDEWIEMSPLFDGVVEFLSILEKENCYIVTTKQERFVKYILEENGIELDDSQIWGLDRNMSKADILFLIQLENSNKNIVFIEDRLASLLDVIEDKRLCGIDLKLVSWGYNTKLDREYGKLDERIEFVEEIKRL